MKRPEWVHCIDMGWQDERQGTSWCGRRVGSPKGVAYEWHFTGLDHAALNGLQGGRLQACPKCSAAALAALTKGTYAP
jgi:hypothetical protein